MFRTWDETVNVKMAVKGQKAIRNILASKLSIVMVKRYTQCRIKSIEWAVSFFLRLKHAEPTLLLTNTCSSDPHRSDYALSLAFIVKHFTVCDLQYQKKKNILFENTGKETLTLTSKRDCYFTCLVVVLSTIDIWLRNLRSLNSSCPRTSCFFLDPYPDLWIQVANLPAASTKNTDDS